ncbi:hypothetical protein OsI_38283 [Oryza sativa Indica Group]|uniref:Uncharacterized protein n=1 Tax=Oryza sativa subsp. indica TaxID=39946 RepID=A2ZKD0_ORYSI|nr:hypothetical protein OsI_38283 [Oryza sativa Indica Group]
MEREMDSPPRVPPDRRSRLLRPAGGVSWSFFGGGFSALRAYRSWIRRKRASKLLDGRARDRFGFLCCGSSGRPEALFINLKHLVDVMEND